jgi:hypothetical protein
MITVRVDDRNFRRAVAGLEDHLRGTRTVNLVIGRSLRDYTKDTIRMGGRSDQPWAPLSPWTIRRTGKTKPLHGLQTRVRYSANKDFAQVNEVVGADNWTLQQHHEGYYTPPRSGNPLMRVPFKSGGAAIFRHAAASVVPARPIWPSYAAAAMIARGAVEAWVSEGARRKWH